MSRLAALLGAALLGGCGPAIPTSSAPDPSPTVELARSPKPADASAAQAPYAPEPSPTVELAGPPKPAAASAEEPPSAITIPHALLPPDSSAGIVGGLGIGRNLHKDNDVANAARSRDIIQRVVRENIPQIKHCYERELIRSPMLEGKVRTRFTIEPAGNVSNAKLDAGMHPEVDACILGVIEKMQFPSRKSGGKVVVRYPFIFKSSAATGATGSPRNPKDKRNQKVDKPANVGQRKQPTES